MCTCGLQGWSEKLFRRIRNFELPHLGNFGSLDVDVNVALLALHYIRDVYLWVVVSTLRSVLCDDLANIENLFAALDVDVNVPHALHALHVNVHYPLTIIIHLKQQLNHGVSRRGVPSKYINLICSSWAENQLKGAKTSAVYLVMVHVYYNVEIYTIVSSYCRFNHPAPVSWWYWPTHHVELVFDLVYNNLLILTHRFNTCIVVTVYICGIGQWSTNT